MQIVEVCGCGSQVQVEDFSVEACREFVNSWRYNHKHESGGVWAVGHEPVMQEELQPMGFKGGSMTPGHPDYLGDLVVPV